MTSIDSMDNVPSEIRTKQFITGHIVIVFSCMCLEAFIYDYAATHFSDSYVKKYLDKMRTLQKLVVIPQLASGKPFPTDGQAYQLVDALLKDRNGLVHYKSGPLTGTEAEETANKQKIDQNVATLPQRVRDAKTAIDSYVKTVISLHPEGKDQIGMIKELIT